MFYFHLLYKNQQTLFAMSGSLFENQEEMKQ
jgi:hypothetical protein